MKNLVRKTLLIGAALALLVAVQAEGASWSGRGFRGPRGGLHVGSGTFRGQEFVYGAGRLGGHRGGFIYNRDTGRAWGFRSGPNYWASGGRGLAGSGGRVYWNGAASRGYFGGSYYGSSYAPRTYEYKVESNPTYYYGYSAPVPVPVPYYAPVYYPPAPSGGYYYYGGSSSGGYVSGGAYYRW